MLLALSGGPDSTALYHLLLQKKIDFHVAHVNHGWRFESEEEASILKKMCTKDNIEFHCKCLESSSEEKNKEEIARNERLVFFKTLLTEYGFEAVLLGHHADDQAETVLKRVFEGASVHHLKGLSFENTVNGVRLWRPWLTVRKKEIIDWLALKGISWFDDVTNKSPQFLRGRMRETLFPFLSEVFGKEITPSLCRLGHSANELHDFFEELLSVYRKFYLEHDEGFSFDCSQKIPKTDFEWKLVIRDFFEEQQISLTKNTLETIVTHLKLNSSHKKMQVGKHILHIHQRKLLVEQMRKRI